MKTLLIVMTTLILIFVFTGCDQKRDDITAVSGSTNVADDVAESAASAIGIDNGGAMDQIADVLEISSTAGMGTEVTALQQKYGGIGIADVKKSYDSTTGWWTIIVDRQRGYSTGYRYAEIHRQYRHQFLNKRGIPQKHWRVEHPDGSVDTAYSIHHIIVSGTGYHRTLRLTHRLDSLYGEWMATGTNTNTVTVNTFNGGAYTRVGKDTMRLRNAERTIDHRLTMTFTNVVGPRGSRLELSQKTGGTITGTFSAKITFTRGDLYREREINRTFTILLGGTNGTAVIRIDNTDYAADVQTGEIVSQ